MIIGFNIRNDNFISQATMLHNYGLSIDIFDTAFVNKYQNLYTCSAAFGELRILYQNNTWVNNNLINNNC